MTAKKPDCFGKYQSTATCQSCHAELKCHITLQLKSELRKRDTTIDQYTRHITEFCSEQNPPINPFDFTQLGLETVENMTKANITALDGKTAPKTLNVRYCAIKAWVFALGMVKSRKMFREIIFDKSSRKNDAIMEMPIEETHVKAMFEITNEHERALVGLYGINGLRPSLIPQARISWIFPQHYKIDGGVFRFTVKNPFMYIPKNLTGNKATGTTFFTILHSRIANAIEHSINNLNAPNTITRDTSLLGRYRTNPTINEKVHELYAQVGFVGRPYLLRAFADYVLDEAGLKRDSGANDEDFKEQLMLHKGVISAIYQNKGIPESLIQTYTRMYQTVENWVNEHLFGSVSQTQLSLAETTALFAQKMGANESQIRLVLDALRDGRMTYDVFNQKLEQLTNDAFTAKMSANMEQALTALMVKRGLILPNAPDQLRSA